jgi:hypothetical protein
MKKIRFVLLVGFAVSFWAVAGFAAVSPWGATATPMSPEKIGSQVSVPGSRTDFDAALIAAADYLQAMQADITDDNAGNGTDGIDESPDDPDDGGWDWRVTSPPAPFHHTTANSPRNLYGVTALGLYWAYQETGTASYFTAMTDAADFMISKPRDSIRTAFDIIFLLRYNELPEVSGTAYQDSAKGKYDGRIAAYGSAKALAEYIRDARAGQGYPNGIIAWDVGAWARAAAMLDARFPGMGYDADADSIAEVLWQDSYNDNPGYFDVIDDQGWDPNYANVNYWWYNLGLCGLIEAFIASGQHTDELPWLVSTLLESQYESNGAVSFSYGAHEYDEDWQSTAYAMRALARYDKSTYQNQINNMGFYLAATQDASGGWRYSSNNHYPEVAGECAAGLYLTTNVAAYLQEPDPFLALMKYSVDPVNGSLYISSYAGGGDVTQWSNISLDVGGCSVPIVSTEIISGGWGPLTGDVLKCTFSVADYIVCEETVQGGLLWDMVESFFDINYEIGGVPHTWGRSVMIRGHISGDLNLDGQANIADLTFLVEYLFLNGPAPQVMEMADVDASGDVNISDLTYYVNYLFRGGPPLQHG